jgi:superfamily II DNA/RNA helicase
MSAQTEEILTSIYQSLIDKEIQKLHSVEDDFFNEGSFLTSTEINSIITELSIQDLVNKGLLIPFGRDKYRTSHLDLIFRLVQIRNLEHQRPIPFEFRIVEKEELVPDFGTYKLTEHLPKLIQVSDKDIVIKCLLDSLRSVGYEGLSSYQLLLIKQLLTPTYQNVAIVAPTASGKTLTFLLPILVKAIQRKLEGKSGVSSILAYPRRALERDQLQNMLKIIDVINNIIESKGFSPITVGIDDSDTKREKDIKDAESFRKLKCVVCGGELLIKLTRGEALVICNQCHKKYPYILPSKEEVWKKRPTILITNMWIIYRRMLVSDTISLFQDLDFIVIDEAHVYTHFLGGHISYILRMLRFIANQRGRNPIFVFSSATIPNPREFISSLAGIRQDDLFYIDFQETLRKAAGKKPRRIMLYLYLLPHPSSDIETLTEALILAVTLWCHKNNVKGITFIDSISEINTMIDYLQTTILGLREGREVSDHIFKTEASPLNDYCWVTLSPKDYKDLSTFKKFVLTDYKKSIEMHYGGLNLVTRSMIENSFIRGDIKMLLSTSTLELGIDLSDVGVILQHKLPLTPEGVVQRVGRSGRNPSCYRTALGIIVLPALPLSTLYMFDERLRETLEIVSFLPPLKIGEISHNIMLQHTISMLLLKRALENKPTYIDTSKEGIRTESESIQCLQQLKNDIDNLSEFNKQVTLLNENDLQRCIRELKNLIEPLISGIERAKFRDFRHDSEYIQDFQLQIDKNINTAFETEDILTELCEVISEIEIIPEDLRKKLQSIRDNVREIEFKLLEFRKQMRYASESRNVKVIDAWAGEELTNLMERFKELPDSDKVSEMIYKLLGVVNKIGFPQFRKQYEVDANKIAKLLANIGEKFGTGERDGLIYFLKELPSNIKKFCSTDFEALYVFKAIERVKGEIKLKPWGLDIFEALNLLLGEKAHFSLLLTSPSPDLELLGVDEA